jgi:putative component of toxin-antitoxin plasmid stabilization module
VLELVNYKTLEGREPFQRWFGDLDVHAAAKVTTALKRIAAGSFSEVKPVGSGGC